MGRIVETKVSSLSTQPRFKIRCTTLHIPYFFTFLNNLFFYVYNYIYRKLEICLYFQSKSKKKTVENQQKKVAELDPPPDFLKTRISIWERCKAERAEWLAKQERKDINIKLPDGKIVEGTSWETTPYDIAAGISKGLADNAVVSKVNGEVWDLDRPFEDSCCLEIVKFDDDEGKVHTAILVESFFYSYFYSKSFGLL